MTFDGFCLKIGEIFDALPNEIKAKVSVSAEDYPSKGALEIMLSRRYVNLYGYWNPITPGNIVLCYWGFKADDDFSDERISAVIKHEFEHSAIGHSRLKHSEHK